jgi:hypothetical protein
LTGWKRAVSALTRSRIPQTLEIVNPKRPLPGRREPWRQIMPQSLLLTRLESASWRPALESWQEAEAAHRAISREIEHARQVVDFGRETAEREAEGGAEVAREAVANALSLALYQKQTIGEMPPAIEQGVVYRIAATFRRCHVRLEQGQLGLLAHLAQRGWRQALRLGGAWALAKLRTFARWARDRYRQALRPGPSRFPATPQERVIRHGYSARPAGLDGPDRALPVIYQHLFRREPLEDSSLLVGRETEMAALAETRELWDAGRSASVLVVGERGSGKTSLLNCAADRVFSDVELVRGQFQERISSSMEMRRFLHSLCGLPDEGELSAALAGARKVIMLEELERSFLRRIDGYQGLRDLLRLIVATSHHVLWIVSINRAGFNFLNAAVSLARSFSHQINIASVAPQALENAILFRHNLSGLRLHFASPPEPDRRAAALRRLFGLEQDPQRRFFNAVSEASGGVFRVAFDLWQSHIERVEDGILYLQYLTPPDKKAPVSGLTLEDLFTLLAILQHGSLTAAEHAIIFQITVADSRTRLKTLSDREVIEPARETGGFRVRSQIDHAVRDALLQRHLL